MTEPCISCGTPTEWCCADCMIYARTPVAVCEKPECRDKHEEAGLCAKDPNLTRIR
jgi:hypothetical protein